MRARANAHAARQLPIILPAAAATAAAAPSAAADPLARPQRRVRLLAHAHVVRGAVVSIEHIRIRLRRRIRARVGEHGSGFFTLGRARVIPYVPCSCARVEDTMDPPPRLQDLMIM